MSCSPKIDVISSMSRTLTQVSSMPARLPVTSKSDFIVTCLEPLRLKNQQSSVLFLFPLHLTISEKGITTK